MQITFTKKSEYYGRNRKGTAVGIEVLPLSNGIITLRPINTRGITDSCNIELPTVVDGLILADEIRKQAMAMAETPDTVCGWLIYMNDDEDAAINEILSSAPLSVLGEAATSKTQAIGIGYEYAPELFKPLYDRYVADQTTAILQQVVDSKILFYQLRDAYKSKLIADIQSKLPNYWVKLDEEYQCRVYGESFNSISLVMDSLRRKTITYQPLKEWIAKNQKLQIRRHYGIVSLQSIILWLLTNVAMNTPIWKSHTWKCLLLDMGTGLLLCSFIQLAANSTWTTSTGRKHYQFAHKKTITHLRLSGQYQQYEKENSNHCKGRADTTY